MRWLAGGILKVILTDAQQAVSQTNSLDSPNQSDADGAPEARALDGHGYDWCCELGSLLFL